MLGQYLNLTLSQNHTILSLYNSNEGNCKDYLSEKVDLTDYIKLIELFESFKPDVVIHCAAISRPELCDELPREFVNNVNVNTSSEIAKLCDKYDTKLIYTSTDLVYDGDHGKMLCEDSVINPVSLYAETKYQSELSIRNIFDNYVILRTSLLYGIGLNHTVNNFHNMYFSFKNGKPVKLFYDQFRTPLSLIDAARLMEKLTNPDIKNITLNFGGSQRVSRSELGEILCEMKNFDKSLIKKISMNDSNLRHKVADVSMNTNKLQSLGFRQKSIDESIGEIIKDY